LVAGAQFPPAHVGSVSVPPAHEVAPHDVPSGAVQLPLPLHAASSQVATFAAQLPCGFVPGGALAHAPFDVGRLHCLHPLQLACGVSQHTPSTQLFDVHDTGDVHAVPFPFFAVQMPPLQ
jgi:hypothetical protein